MQNNDITEYDLTDVYEKEIQEKVFELERLCSVYNIPFFATFATKNDSESTVYQRVGVMPGSRDIHLTNDLLSQYLLLQTGNFDILDNGTQELSVVPRRDQLELFLDDPDDIEDAIDDLED
jgi:hypothetical protein